ncbi:hypothetical protein BKA04_001555 [Cryobacterium mesophilum]|uniref:DUF2975 domain-containing protein n=1 Tax=Terrimesophilobacter mesophilus TaxID=433647 RepID=A0A4R8VCB3_9MICO|nr:hypothetical protein [Terrimesophilobacter mesophilus]MBB5633332.1 hypothetical protein [Terrimesophilobacter mesophilus]TFB80066.1 hypothetical protein E3N84_08425 [Terrimesophilobacter mesophilus]
MAFISWWFVAALVVILGLVVTVVIVRRNSAQAGQDHRPAVLVVGQFLALLYAGVALVGTVVNTITTLVSDSVQVSLPMLYLPATFPWITLDPAPAASVVGGGTATTDVLVAGLGMDARLLLAAGTLIQGITIVVIAGVVALLCHRLLAGSPFRPLLTRWIMRTAALIAVGGLVWQVCYGVGNSIASHQLLAPTGWRGDTPSEAISDYVFTVLPGSGLPAPTLAVQIDFWPLFLGLALAAVAIAFRYSERLQRDTEGLV